MYRFFVNSHEINWQDKKATIQNPNQSNKISRVLRLRENDQIVLLDGNGLSYTAQITSFFSRGVQCRLLSRRAINTEPKLKITVAQALLKGNRFDYALQKNTELGAYEFIPVTCKRTVVRYDDEDLRSVDKKLNRFQAIVQGAAEQSERGMVPIVKDVVTVEELCKSNLSDYDLKLICQERSDASPIKKVLDGLQEKINKILLFVGPEGGFMEEEINQVLKSGFISVNLGKRIYRAETVGTVLLSILYFYFNELN